MPATLAVRPGLLWKAFLDAGSFVLLFVLAAHALRELGVLPTLFTVL